MNEEDYKRWKKVMFRSLRYCYTHLEARYIIDFWDRIKAATEKEMLGPEYYRAMKLLGDAMLYQLGLPFHVRLASEWSHRCWLYAPMLAAEYHKTKKPRKGERHAENQK